MQTFPPFRSTLLAVAAGVLFLAGCDTTIEPFSEKATYSIYGILSLNRARQFVRVKSLQAPLDGDTSRMANVTVTLENVSTSGARTLKDSVIIFRDANSRVVTHNYWTDDPIEPGTKYKLTVSDAEGTTTAASTMTPPRVRGEASPEKGNCVTEFIIEFPGIDDARRISNAVVQFDGTNETLRFPVDRRRIHSATGGQPDDAYLAFTPNGLLSREFGYSADDPDTPCTRETHCSSLASKEIEVLFTYLGKDWYGHLPDDTLSADPLSSPQIENGSGLFASMGRGRTSVVTETTAASVDDPTCP